MKAGDVQAPVLAQADARAQPLEQLRYARWIEWGTRAGLAVLLISFFAYAGGLIEPHIPHGRLPQVWTLPVDAFLRATGMPTGWGWFTLAHRGDIANLLGIVLLAGCSLAALLAVLPMYARRGERVYIAICVAELAVVLLAASGVLTAGH